MQVQPHHAASFSSPELQPARSGSGRKSATFLTGVAVATAVEEPKAMQRVRDEHGKLQEVVGTLSEKISAVLSRQESDFLTAYKSHMHTVQEELKTLRTRVIEAESALQSDDQVHRLEEESEWYRKEALRLDTFNTAMRKDIKYMKEKMDILEDDRKWLVKQLKMSKRQNKTLKEELGRRDADDVQCNELPHSEAGGSRVMQKSSSAAVVASSSPPQPLLHSSTTPLLPRAALTGKQTETRDALLNAPIVTCMSSHRRAQTTPSQLRVDSSTSRSEFEQFLYKCINDCRKDILRRRRAGQQHLPKQHVPASSPLSLEEAARPWETKNMRISDFTPADRRIVLERLVFHDKLFSAICTSLWPPAGVGSSIHQGDCGGSGNDKYAGKDRSLWSKREDANL